MRAAWGLVGLAVALAGAARAETLAVKTGLWETTVQGDPNGAVPPLPADMLSKLTPEQQAQLRQRMAEMARQPMTHRTCITAETLEKAFAGPSAAGGCTRTLVSSSAQAMEFRLVCTGRHQANGTFHLQAADPQTVNGTMDLVVTSPDGQTTPIHRTMQSRWLGADCGNVKPRE